MKRVDTFPWGLSARQAGVRFSLRRATGGLGNEIYPDLTQGDVWHHGAGAWRKIEREHEYSPGALWAAQAATARLANPSPRPNRPGSRRSQPAVTVAGTGDTYHILF